MDDLGYHHFRNPPIYCISILFVIPSFENASLQMDNYLQVYLMCELSARCTVHRRAVVYIHFLKGNIQIYIYISI